MITNPDTVQTFFAVVNGWDSTVANVPPGFRNIQGILITVWVYRGNNSLTGNRRQTLIWANNVAYREYNSKGWTNWVVIDNNKITTDLAQKAQSIINGINYDVNLTRTYQLEPCKAYLVTAFSYSSDNVDATNNSGAYFVYTPGSIGANGAIKEIYSSNLTLNIDTNCLLSIAGNYQYMHYSITKL